MGYIDTAICKALDRLHANLAGLRSPCRWTYDARTDTYACAHISVPGREVVGAVNENFV